MLRHVFVLGLFGAALCAPFETMSLASAEDYGLTDEEMNALPWGDMMDEMVDLTIGSIDSGIQQIAQAAANRSSTSLGGLQGLPKIPVGLFVGACQDRSVKTGSGRLVALSVATTREFERDGTFHADTTRYYGDPNCLPNKGKVVTKFIMYGQVTMRGPSAIKGNPPNAQKISYQTTKGTYLMPQWSGSQRWIDELNQDCPCDQKWAGGVARNVSANQCKPPPKDASDFCRTISGAPRYASVAYVNQNDFIASGSSWDQLEGWTQLVNKSYYWQGVSESGDQTPEDCDYFLWSSCEAPSKDASNICGNCWDLECYGCIYRTLDQRDATGKEWDKCCPCLHYYANTAGDDNDFLHINC